MLSGLCCLPNSPRRVVVGHGSCLRCPLHAQKSSVCLEIFSILAICPCQVKDLGSSAFDIKMWIFRMQHSPWRTVPKALVSLPPRRVYDMRPFYSKLKNDTSLGTDFHVKSSSAWSSGPSSIGSSLCKDSK